MSTAFRPLSIASAASSCFIPRLSIPPRPIQLHSQSSLFTPLCILRTKSRLPSLVACVAQTSEWEDDNITATIDQDQEETNETEWDSAPQSSEEDGGFQEPPEDAKLFVGNLPYDIDSESLAMLFEKAGTVEISEVIYNRETDRSRGFGFVTMSTVAEAEKAVEIFNGFDVNGRLLTVNKAAPKGTQPERTPRVYEPAFRVYVGNLPWSVDDTKLEQVFSEHGKVVDARVVIDRETGRSRGFGFVTMSTETELNDAIAALDGQSLDGRAIRVNVAADKPRRSNF